MTTDWKARELDRFRTGEYKPVPVQLDYPAEHYVHLSVKETEADYVAYTPSEQYGEADRQVRLRYGRYLRKAFPQLTDAEIQSYVTALKSAVAIENEPATLHFATDVETINRIFETCMKACGSSATSCMYGKFDQDDVRPYHVYADSPDVAVAYVTAGGKIQSRSVVSVKNEVWVRAYSVADGDNDTDCGTLKRLLKEAGYEKGDLIGNRLTKLDTYRVMLPYIDNGGAEVSDRGDYWLVAADGEGDYKAENIDGTAEECGNRCECCGDRSDDCECYRCECCEGLSRYGCDDCSICSYCDGCITHDGCNCDRCERCGERTEHRRGYDHCECDRCEHCNELVRDCECDVCETCNCPADDCECCSRCHQIPDNCDCETDEDSKDDTETDDTETQPETTADTDITSLTVADVQLKLNGIWQYLQKQGDYSLYCESDAMRLVHRAFDSLKGLPADLPAVQILTAEPVTWDDAKGKLNRAWTYLRDSGHSTDDSAYQVLASAYMAVYDASRNEVSL